MIKRIIFDLDNTLIMWDNNYYRTLNQSLEEVNIDYDKNTIKQIIRAVDDYENRYNKYDKLKLLNLMREYSKLDFIDSFIDVWMEHLKHCVPEKLDSEVISTLEYLNSKYELVVLTNWFTEQQVCRLRNAGILNFFIDTIGTDIVLNKPNKESFEKALGQRKVEECIMVGDSIKTDIEGAKNIKMEAILFDYDNKYTGYKDKRITKIGQLKEML